MEFQAALEKNFKFKYRPDRRNLPIVTILRRSRRHGEVAGVIGLAEMMRDMEFQVGVEIGTYLGDSASIWCKTNPNLNLTCVDPYAPYTGRRSTSTQESIYQAACEALKPYRATIMRVASMEAVPTFADDSLDFVFIDGDHLFDPCMMDLICWVPKVRKGGMVLLHDYTVMQGPGVIKAVDAYTHCHSISPWYATMDYTPTVFWEQI
uniref:Putative methyltransferase n=1 Tax=viral metagenome TaxID=1070528 RepID=A0A6M3JPR9_9ZZZZ